ncbi:hypothetical protein CR513_00301, partial [Mucuna pruriens]
MCVMTTGVINVSAQINSIQMLNGTNFKVWKEIVDIVLGCMNLDLVLWVEEPIPTMNNLQESQSASKFLEEIEQFFAKNEKAETSNLLVKLIFMKYKGRGNIKEYIIEMSNLAAKLNSLKLELDEDLIVHLTLISLHAHFGQFKVSYNTQKDKWSLNELISHYVQEEERKCGIVPQYTMPEKPSMNGVIGRRNQTLKDMLKHGLIGCMKENWIQELLVVTLLAMLNALDAINFTISLQDPFFETGNARILEEVEFEKEDNIKNVVFEEEFVNDIGQVLVPITI